jgi:hypothetical protein
MNDPMLRPPAIAVSLSACLAACGDNSASGGSSASGGDTGADSGPDDDLGPHGGGCEEPWEGWWDQPQPTPSLPPAILSEPEAAAQRGRWHASGWPDTSATPTPPLLEGENDFRSTLISEAAVLSTGRNIGVSWCLGSIHPNPMLPGGVIDEERDALNLASYELLRAELERATRIWERHSRMNFVHLAALDDRRKPSGGMCNTALEHVWFRAQTTNCDVGIAGQMNAGGENEFDPEAASPTNPLGYPRYLCIAWQRLQANHKVPWLVGHESGHIVGLAHEHIRWSQDLLAPSLCRENHPYLPVSADRTLTPRDPWSVMGYPECTGIEKSNGISPHDMLGAYYTFNWTERRVRDMAPATGGRDQRLWAGDDRPGVLWYLPFSNHLLEWRFDDHQSGPLTFGIIERCLDGGPPCMLTDTRGHWHPVMGQFTGSSKALDVFMYGADNTPDLLLRNAGHDQFEAIEMPAPDRAVPVVGNFGPGNRDQILWYRPGPASDHLWIFDDEGGYEARTLNQDSWQIPVTGHFRNRTHSADIIWFEPREATVEPWIFGPDFSVIPSSPGSAAYLGVEKGNEYVPIVGNFNGDNLTDLFWYTPGSASDWLWLSVSNVSAILFESHEFHVNGEYRPIVGDFDGDGTDDIFWYRPAVEVDGGPSRIWYFDGHDVETRSVWITGDYTPYVEDFDGDGCTDILWVDPVAPSEHGTLWRCVPDEKTFSCEPGLPVPKTAYPIGFATGGY